MTSTPIVPMLVVPLVVWRIYRRFRRNIGRQRLRRGRQITGIVVLSVVTALIGFFSFAFLPSLGALGGGILLGASLAVVSLRLTKFESSPEGEFYTPNTAIGMGVTLLLAGRIAYRVSALYGMPQGDRPAPAPFQSPFTLLVFGLTTGYYIAYYSGLLMRSRKNTGGAVNTGV